MSLHWLITGKGPKELVDENADEESKSIFVTFNEVDRQLVQKIATEEGRTLQGQVDRLIAEALIERGLVPSRYEILAPILKTLDGLPVSRRQTIAKSLRKLCEDSERKK